MHHEASVLRLIFQNIFVYLAFNQNTNCCFYVSITPFARFPCDSNKFK